MKILTVLFFIISGIIISFTFSLKAEAYSYKISTFKPQRYYQYNTVNGYYKSNGNYVNSYRRGVSNSIREDNLNYNYKNIFGRRVYPNR